MVRVHFDPYDPPFFVILESIHELIGIAVYLEPDEPAAPVKKGDPVYLSILVHIQSHYLFPCPCRFRLQQSNYGQHDKKREKMPHNNTSATGTKIIQSLLHKEY